MIPPNKALTAADKDRVIEIIRDFITTQRVSCPEATTDDGVYINAPELVYDLANIVGYVSYKDEYDDE